VFIVSPPRGEEPPAPFYCCLSSGTIALIRCSDQTADAGIGIRVRRTMIKLDGIATFVAIALD
jgi:hypothetical protein